MNIFNLLHNFSQVHFIYTNYLNSSYKNFLGLLRIKKDRLVFGSINTSCVSCKFGQLKVKWIAL